MKKLFFQICFFVVAAIMVGCKQDVVPIAFNVSSESVVEGQPLPFTVAITRGGHDGYRMIVDVSIYDVATGNKTSVEAEVYCGNTPLKGRVDFPDHGRRDFNIPGLEAGTYLVSVSLSKNGYDASESVVSVVLQANTPGHGGIDPPEPVDPVEVNVESFEIPTLALTDGQLVLCVGAQQTHTLSWEPKNATKIDFGVSTSNETIVVASITNGILTIYASGAGNATLTITVPGGPTMMIPVVVKPIDVPVESFEINGLILTDGRLVMNDPETLKLPLSWRPADATKTVFTAKSSDESIVAAAVDGSFVVLETKYPGDAVVTIAVEDGPSMNFSVRVRRHVKVTIEWQENEATPAQIKTKTFPCLLKISSDSDRAFPDNIVFTVTFKGVINVNGHDTQSVSVKDNIYFSGDKISLYNVTSKFLLPCYQVYRTDDFSLSITMTLQRYDSNDKDYWVIEYDETFKIQDARIRQYITSIQQ